MIDLSVIIAAHNEGHIAHKTLKSVHEAVQQLKAAGVTYEVLVTLDNPDDATMAYFERQTVLPVTVHKTTFGELAAARNYGIKQATGAYVALLDADDLVSRNWFADGLALAKKYKKVIIHTEYSVNFGQASIIWHKHDSLDTAREALRNFQANQWDSAIIAAKALLKEFPFVPNGNGFAPEDWHLNGQTLAAGIPHKVAPRSILFVRRKEVSLMTHQASQKQVPHYTDLLAIDVVKRIPESVIESVKAAPLPTDTVADTAATLKRVAAKSARLVYQKTKHIPAVQTAGHALKSALKRHQPEPTSGLPAWLVDDWRHAHTIERLLFPSADTLQHTVHYDSTMYELGIFYWQLVKHISTEPTYIIFVPHLIQGGADLVAINYANSIAKLDPTQKVLVIATEADDNPWASKLDKAVDFLPFGTIAGGLPLDLQLQTLARLVVQTKALNLHNIHSHQAFLLFNTYRRLFTANPYKLFISAFCDDVDTEGRTGGHIHSGLPLVHDMAHKILTDNAYVIEKLEDEYGYRTNQFVTHYQPTYPPRNTFTPAEGTPSVLWASRICKQKRPDVLRAIAQQLAASGSDIIIDVYGVMEEGFTAEYFADCPNINYCGGFNGLDSILEKKHYQILLYTAEKDGLPNTILEAASRGVPAIAPNIGGIKELVTGNFLIEHHEDAAAYCQQLIALGSDMAALQNESARLLKLIGERHTIESYEAFVRTEILADLEAPQAL